MVHPNAEIATRATQVEDILIRLTHAQDSEGIQCIKKVKFVTTMDLEYVHNKGGYLLFYRVLLLILQQFADTLPAYYIMKFE